MINLMIYSIEQTLTDEGKKEFRHALEYPVERQQYKKLVSNTNKPKTVSVTKAGKWKAPPGWTPPGWDEENSYKTAMSFMGFQANPK